MVFDTSNIVSEAFDKVAKEKSKYKPITVEKLLDLQYDLGTLMATDTNEIDTKQLRSNRDEYLLNLARDNTQLLINKLWELPSENVEDTVVVKLPKQLYKLPREKPIPLPKPPTRWEQFAKDKGIQQRKKAKVTWDDILKKWVPVHGYRRAAAERDKNWVLEVPQNADPYEDRFEKRAKTKNEKVAKNEFQRLRNIAQARNIKVPHMGLPPSEQLSSSQLNTAEGLAKVSTASIGKFQPPLRKEKVSYKEQVFPGAKKRKVAPMVYTDEKTNNMNILNEVMKKKPKLNVAEGVNNYLLKEQKQEAEEKNTFRSKKRGSAGKRDSGKPLSAKKPKPGGGRRNPHTKQHGRKRR